MKYRKNYRFSEETMDCLRFLVRHYGGQLTETDIVEDAINEKWDRVQTSRLLDAAWARATDF